jgi:hypothetical protein
MKNDKEHLDIDLGFLDKKNAPKSTPLTAGPTVAPVSTGYKYNWKNILIIGAIVLFVGWGIFSGSENPKSKPSSTNTSNYGTTNSNSANYIATGQYRCSRPNHDEAARLNPDLNNYQNQNLANQKSALQTRSNELDAEKAQLQSELTSIDQNDQSAVEAYNVQVNSYNVALQQFNVDQQNFSNAIDAYNAGVLAYNNYLTQHCTPQ